MAKSLCNLPRIFLPKSLDIPLWVWYIILVHKKNLKGSKRNGVTLWQYSFCLEEDAAIQVIDSNTGAHFRFDKEWKLQLGGDFYGDDLSALGD